MGWYGPQSGDCSCCEKGCQFFRYSAATQGHSLSMFEVISGTWVEQFNGIAESTGSGILLAKGTTDGLGTEHLAASFTSSVVAETRYDLVFDWIDSDNYQVLKFREVSSVLTLIVSRVENSVEADVFSAAVPWSSTGNLSYFVRNNSPLWAFSNGSAYYLLDELPQYGGTRFGVRSNSGGDTSQRINSFYCLNSVDAAITGLVNGYFAREDEDNPHCVVNPENIRCDKCIHLCPQIGSGQQWKITIGGVAGTCGSGFNGTYFIDTGYDPYPTFATGATGPCASIHAEDNPCWSSVPVLGFRVEFFLNSYNSSYGAPPRPPGVRLWLWDPNNFSARLCYFLFSDASMVNDITPIWNCYTDWPQELTLDWYYPPDSEVDYSGATCTVELV